jgi:hypothetical protein
MRQAGNSKGRENKCFQNFGGEPPEYPGEKSEKWSRLNIIIDL